MRGHAKGCAGAKEKPPSPGRETYRTEKFFAFRVDETERGGRRIVCDASGIARVADDEGGKY